MTRSQRRTIPPGRKALMLRTCKADMTSYKGFVWPESGYVEAGDWDSRPNCGHGLHGLLWGEGGSYLLSQEADARWLVVEVDLDLVTNLTDKVKVPSGVVVHCGSRGSATRYLLANGGSGHAVIGATVVAGDYGAAVVGHYGTAAAGFQGTATAGDYGTATAGDYGTATAGFRGSAMATKSGVALAGEEGRAVAGLGGVATAWRRGHAVVGDGGTAIVWDGGVAAAGARGTLVFRGWNALIKRPRVVVGYVGEDGIAADRPYRVVAGVLEEVSDADA